MGPGSKENKTKIDKQPSLFFRNKSLALWLVILFSLLLYLPTIRYDFVYDDEVLLPHHPWIKHPSHIPKILTSSVWDDTKEHPIQYYRPVQLLLYQAVYLIFGLHPAAYHFLNVIFYVLLCTSIFFLFLLLIPESRMMALAATFIFIAHPSHTEAVAWAASLSELTFCSFFIISLICYIRGQLAHSKCNKIGFHAIGCVLFLLAMLSKEMAVSLPLILIMSEILLIPQMRETTPKQGTSQKNASSIFRNFLAVLFYLGTLLIALSLRAYALGDSLPQQQYPEIQGFAILWNALWLIASYWGKLIFPLLLNVFYIYEPIQYLMDIRSIIGLLVTMLGIIAIYCVRHKDRYLAFSIGWIFLSLLPVLYIKVLPANVFADRYLLIPSVGFALAITRIAWHLTRSRRVLTALLLVILVLFSIRTMTRNEDWKNSIALYEKTLQSSPEAALIHNNLAVVLLRKGDTSRAIQAYEQAVHFKPDFIMGWRNLGTAYEQEGRKEEALRAYQRAAQLDPEDPKILNNIGSILANLHQYDEAIPILKKAVTLSPNFIEPRMNLGLALLSSGQINESISEFRRVLELDPKKNKARVTLAAALIQIGKVEEARIEAAKVQGELAHHPIIRKLFDQEQRSKDP